MALHGQDTAALASFSDRSARDPALAATRDKVTVETDATLSEMQARVVITDRTGAARTLTHDLDAPIPLADRAARLRVKGRALLGTAREDRLWAATAADHPDIDALARLMAEGA